MQPSTTNTDPRITIRWRPRQIKAVRRIVQAFHDTPNVAALLGLGCEDLEMAAEALSTLPLIAPAKP